MRPLGVPSDEEKDGDGKKGGKGFHRRESTSGLIFPRRGYREVRK